MDMLINSSVNHAIVQDWAFRLLENANESQWQAIGKDLYQLGMIDFSNQVKNHLVEIDKMVVKPKVGVSSELRNKQKNRLAEAHQVDANKTHAFI